MAQLAGEYWRAVPTAAATFAYALLTVLSPLRIAGFPETSSVASLNRQCSSGLQAVTNIANMITAGQIDCGIGSGVESMTMGYGAGVMPEKMSEQVLDVEAAADCLLPMGITSESVFGVLGLRVSQN